MLTLRSILAANGAALDDAGFTLADEACVRLTDMVGTGADWSLDVAVE